MSSMYPMTRATMEGIYGVPLYPNVKVYTETGGDYTTITSIKAMVPIRRDGKVLAVLAKQSFRIPTAGVPTCVLLDMLHKFEELCSNVEEKYNPTGWTDPLTGDPREIELI